MNKNPAPTPARTWAYPWFFPAASIYAALAIPLSVHAMTSGMLWPPGLAGSGHAYEMLFGFALALVAGYTLGQMPSRELLALFAFWLGARLMILVPFDTPRHIFNALFVITLAWHAVPRFLAAKKWRNRALSPLLLGLCAFPVVYAIADYVAPTMEKQRLLLQQVVLLVSLLMAFMGGRIIPAAAAGEAQRLGFEMEARVQPRFEAALIILLSVAAVALFFPKGNPVAGSSTAAAGCAAAIRCYRWRLWRLRKRPDLICLGMGYCWLALGLLLYGREIFFEAPRQVAILHIITVGALGTLSTGVMARLQFQHSARHAPPLRIVLTAAVLIVAAAALRVAAGAATDDRVVLLWAAALCWSGAYLYFAFHFLAGLWDHWLGKAPA
ncbi:MAG TPA: NnrS family protein [Gammaproteobacteria bacterium]|nr:NnrS family protein [Gammaproteobacteria bacterium]